MRGPLAPSRLPFTRTRAERFDDLILDAVELLESRWASELGAVDFAVEEVPPVSVDAVAREEVAPCGRVPLSCVVPGAHGSRPRIVIYRRPLETRAEDATELGSLIHRVVVEEFANVLGLEPEKVDPSIGDAD